MYQNSEVKKILSVCLYKPQAAAASCRAFMPREQQKEATT